MRSTARRVDASTRWAVKPDLTIASGRGPLRLGEHGSLPAAPGVPRGGAPSQLQRRGARARRLAVGGEPGGAAARGAAARRAPRPHDAQRVADRRGTGGSWTAPARRWRRRLAALTEVSAQPGETVGRVRLSVPRDGGALRHRSGAAHVSRAPPAHRGRGRRRGSLRRHRGRGLRRRRAAQRGDRARHGAGAPHRRRFASSSSARPATSRATARPSAPRISCATSASPSARRPRARSTRGSSSADAGTGACRFAAASSAATRRLIVSLAEQGLGLAYAFEPMVLEQLRAGRLQRVLERYAPTVPGFFLYFPEPSRGARRRCASSSRRRRSWWSAD